ncbi:fumarylacetoacetate hydrolase family protein [Pandoraea terrigena]|uniref:5-carboxymethyl-2-hydroxymuconate isomerase n=1 Tax=Pandoraea terrigena TaxID=2508292 RepID=A0A5E4UA83_9BURK|nr:fumarylacetoacetate hydrolase family protein [Pandoraea terrigena]VVD96967.1 5-carboxymethyl-2-hydroxymuconate isomerase [Pandoraea terrigena]
MRLLSFEHGGRVSWGVIGERGGIIDLGALTGRRFPTLRSALEANAFNELTALASARNADLPVDDIRFLPVIPEPQKIFCVGLNYEAHRVEANRPKTGHPAIFVRTATSQVGHNENLVVPTESPSLDYEGELAIVIGKAGRRINESDAWSHIAGYAAYNDGSVREWQQHTTQWTSGKNFDATGAFGPWLVTRDEIEDGAELSLVTRLNGVEMQRATTHMMIFDIPSLISYASAFATLVPGDVILTGTPGGVGFKRQPPVFMRPGDLVEVEIERVGTLKNRVVAESINPTKVV